MKINRIVMAACVMCTASALAPRMMHAASPMLPSDYDMLNQKSIFSKNRRTVNPYRQDVRPVRPIRTPKNYTPVFIGTLAEDAGYFVAFIQDPGSGRMLEFIEGDALPDKAGTIKDIALDYIEVSSATPGGPDKKITVGQTILGGVAEYPSSDDSSQGQGPITNGRNGPPDAGGDAANGGPPDASTTAAPAAPASDPGADDLITRLRKRRQAQLGG